MNPASNAECLPECLQQKDARQGIAAGGSLGLMTPASITTDLTAQWVHAVAAAFNIDSKTLVVPR